MALTSNAGTEMMTPTYLLGDGNKAWSLDADIKDMKEPTNH